MATSTINKSMLADDAVAQQMGGWAGGSEGATSSFLPQSTFDGAAGGRARKIHKLDVAEVTAQLSIMTKSGVDLASALSSLATQCQRPALTAVLKDVQDSVMSGSSFSDALKKHPTVFDPTFVATVAAGEASGRMAEVLQQLAAMQKNVIRRGREIRSLMTYPVLLLLVSSSVLVALVLFVLPRFTAIFEQYDMPLPAITQFFLTIADELWVRWWLYLPTLVGSLIALLLWRRSESGRSLLDRFWISGPMVGEICRGMCIGGTCRLMGLMLDNGVTLLESLKLTRQAMRNTHYKSLLADLEDAVINGQSLASVLQPSEVVPASAKEMIITAEATGNMNEVTVILGQYFEDESEAKLRQLVGVLEPVITVVMGAIVAIVVLAVMLPVFNLSTFAAGGR